MVDAIGDQVMKEKEEKDTRIQVDKLIIFLFLPCFPILLLTLEYLYYWPDSWENCGETKRGVEKGERWSSEGERKASEGGKSNLGFC